MINNFGEIVSSLLTADHTCRRSEDESWEGLLLLLETRDKIFARLISGRVSVFALLKKCTKDLMEQIDPKTTTPITIRPTTTEISTVSVHQAQTYLVMMY